MDGAGEEERRENVGIEKERGEGDREGKKDTEREERNRDERNRSWEEERRNDR